MKRPFVAALTGGSGAGKSLAAGYLSSKGVPVIDGDDIARKVVVPGSRCLSLLVDEFSSDILFEDGSLNRKKLGAMCFSDSGKRERLNAIIHPFIIEDLKESVEALHGEGFRYCVVQAPALLESGLHTFCDRVILITAGQNLQIARISKRDGISEEDAKARLDAQAGDERLREIADVEIVNDGSKAEFLAKTEELLQLFSEWFE